MSTREAVADAAQPMVGLDDALVREVREALDRQDPVLASALAAPLHPSDQADLIQLLDPPDRAALLKALGSDLHPDTLTYLAEEVRESVIDILGPRETGAAVAQLDTDDAVEVLGDLDPEEQSAILAALPMPERVVIEQGLAFPEYSAGRLMQRDVVAVPEYWNVGQVIDYLRATPDLPDDFYDIIIVDARFRPVGAVPLSKVLRSRRGVPLGELKIKELRLVPVTMDQEQVAFLFRQYGLVSAPVVDDAGRLLGVITVDDVVDVIQEEAEDDILKLGGVQETDVFASPLETSRKRVPWLLLSLVSAAVGATVIHHFEESIEQLVALAVLMPISAALGGNAGVQTLAVVVRALAVKELTRSNALRVMLKELTVGLLNSTVIMAVAGTLTLLWFGSVGLALVFAGSIVVTICVAALIGITVPLVLDRLGFDPAIASSVFVTPTIDAIGFFTFLTLATFYLL
jgi:magnesium transporter